MKVFIVVAHEDFYGRGPNAFVTTDEDKAKAKESELYKQGYIPLIEEHEVVV